MSFVVAIIIGGIIGWLASLIMKTNAQMGLIANIVVGIVGSLLGHWAAGALGIAAVGSLGSFIVALLGAVILIAILRAVGIFQVRRPPLGLGRGVSTAWPGKRRAMPA